MVLLVKQKEVRPVVSIKDGTYKARVSNIKTFSNNYGERIGFEFTISGGQYDGEQVMRSTAPQLSRQSKLAEVIEGVIGREMTEKELMGGFDLEDLIDQSCSILVLQNKTKTGVAYSNIERVFNA